MSCNNNDNVSEASITIGENYFYRVPDCEAELPTFNGCVAMIRFTSDSEVNILPFGDAIFILRYEVVGDRVTIFFSDINENDVDPTYIIESADVLIEENTGNRFVIE